MENPWHALWAMMVGFFMILLDATIVAVANPEIMKHVRTDYDSVIWVTSAYLLAYAVPLLLAGRLGDRFGPKNLYLVGLAVFTFASLGCGLAGSLQMLVAARVVQGVGAVLHQRGMALDPARFLGCAPRALGKFGDPTPERQRLVEAGRRLAGVRGAGRGAAFRGAVPGVRPGRRAERLRRPGGGGGFGYCHRSGEQGADRDRRGRPRPGPSR